ncbi:MAG: 50S ribosomal protein L15 [Elusimicrobiota bacterium]|nr:50S ribosomal protein L15 [Elusimicrobiota bacterium]
MGLNNLKPARGSKHRKKIVGRGYGSGHGRTATRGTKGQKSRSGDGTKKVGFEGGQSPISRRIPKRGFTNGPFRKIYAVVNLDQLNNFEQGLEITPALLKQKGLVSQSKFVKILGNGKLEKPLNFKGLVFSKTAADKAKQAGASIEAISKKN